MNSMTGFGTAEGKVGSGELFIEVKSVNHRFTEVSVKLPPRMSVLESYIRAALSKMFFRGRIDVFIKEKQPLFGASTVSVDFNLAKKYQKALQELKEKLLLPGDVDFIKVVSLDRILKVEEDTVSYEKFWPEIGKLVLKAADSVSKMRKREGEHIFRDQTARLKKVARTVEKIRVRAEKNVDGKKKKATQRINGERVGQGGERIPSDVMLGARQDIAEEVVRLASHLKQYAHIMNGKEAAGRKLDFLLQEMVRESNTIGAKSADAKISQLVVECKSELERLKEQVQNVE